MLYTNKYKIFGIDIRKVFKYQEVFTEIINLTAILNLPEGTEHFLSDLHGIIKEKNRTIFLCR